jgi:hypothetical protein
MSTVFVSYKSDDRERVRKLVASLRRSGLSVWWDQDIPPDADWEESITQALETSSCVIVCWSRKSVHSRTGRKVKAEARVAEEKDKLLQVLIDLVSPPLFFSESQAIDLNTWEGNEADARFQRLAQAARDVLDGRPPSAILPGARKRRRKRGFVVFATLTVLVFAGLGAGMFFSAKFNTRVYATLGQVQHALIAKPGDPVVIGIYPTDSFGPQHRQGMHAGLAPYARDLRIIDLQAPYDEMKEDQADEVLRQLRRLIIEENVVAVVGPPVTEFTRSVIREVERTGLPTPIFITSATSRSAAGWTETSLPLFRINSGVDERSHEFVGLARAAIAADIPLTFLVESRPNSDERLYGQILFDSIAAEIPEWPDWVKAGNVTWRTYPRGKIVDELAGWNADAFLDRRQIIMLLGVGSDYLSLAKGYFRQNQPTRQSLLGGWMNAYTTEPAFRAGAYQWSRLLEVTDMRFNIVSEREAAGRFLREFGLPSPAIRDQAFSFDSGSTIANAVLETLGREPSDGLRTTHAFLTRLTDVLKRKHVQGATGEIRFDALGQNVGESGDGLMTYAQFDGQTWQVLDGVSGVLALLGPPTDEAPPAQE